MFDIGFGELLLIGVVALVVLAILNYILKPAPMQQPGTAQPQA